MYRKILLMLLLLGCSSLVHAAELQLGLSALDMNYREFDDNDFQLNREDGILPGITGVLRLEGDAFYSSLHASYHTATIKYDGYTQNLIPVQTNTATDILNLQYRLVNNTSQQLHWYGGIGFRHWRREILPTVIDTGGGPQGVAGLLEEYSWFYALLGIDSQLVEFQNSTLNLDLQVTRMFQARIHIDFLGYGGYDDKTLDLGEKTNFRVALPWRFKLRNNYTWTIEPYFETWDIGKSNTASLEPGIIIYEPRSETRNAGINIWLHLPI